MFFLEQVKHKAGRVSVICLLLHLYLCLPSVSFPVSF